MIKVLHLNTTNSGGAFSAADRLNKAMLLSNIESKIITKQDVSFNDSNYATRIFLRIKNKIFKPYIQHKNKYLIFNNRESKNKDSTIVNKIINENPDIIILHWVSGFINAKDIYNLSLKTKAKIYWYLLDMAPFTGGCHYAWECLGYRVECNHCPGSDKKGSEIIRDNFVYRRKWLTDSNIEIVAGAKRILEQSSNSALFYNFPHSLIYIAVNQKIFKKINKQYLRDSFSIGSSKKVLFFGSTYLKEERKGMSILKSVLNKIYIEEDLSNIVLLIAGNDYDENDEVYSKFNVKYVGKISTDLMLSFCYNVSDIFISPSIEDAGPMMINEAVSCEVPVVSFDIGVAKDIVKNGVNGFTVPLYEIDLMKKAILDVFNNKLSMNPKDIITIKNKLNYKTQVNSFINLFKA